MHLRFLIAFVGLLLAGCQSQPDDPIRTESSVDLGRFAGTWYVIAHIPTFLEDQAYNAVEIYDEPSDGRIPTTFRFREGGFNGEEKVYNPVGFVREGTGNAVWGMQFVWPIKAEYRIVFVDDDYERTIIGRTKRDYVWLMAREPIITEGEYQELVTIIREEGYDPAALRKVPQQPRGER